MLLLKKVEHVQTKQPEKTEYLLVLNNIFHTVKQASAILEKTEAILLYKIKTCQILAIRVVGQWRVSIKSEEILNIQDICNSLPGYLRFEEVCNLFKIRETILFRLIGKRYLDINEVEGTPVITKDCLIKFIQTQNNIELELD